MVLLSLLLLIQDPAPAAARPDPAANPAIQAIRAASAKLGDAKSYTVQQTVQDEGMPPTDVTPAAGAPPATPPSREAVVFTAHVQKGKPTHFLQEKLEAWREGDVMVFRNADGVWEKFGKSAGDDPKTADPDAARNMRTRMNLARTQVAHEMLARLDEKIATATESKDGAKVVITGSFTPEGAASLGQRFSKGGQDSKEGSGKTETSGTFRFVIAADGNLESVTYDVQAKGGAKDAAVERKRHVELRVSAVNSTSMEVPAEVKAALAGKAVEKPDAKPVDKPQN